MMIHYREGCLHLDKVYSNCRILHIRYAKRKLYLINHEGYQYILVDSDIEDCHVGRIDIEDDATEYPLKDCHGEMEVSVCICVQILYNAAGNICESSSY